MSSATSTETAERNRLDGAGQPPPGTERRDAMRPWHFFVMASLLAATTAVVLARDARPEHLVLISLTIGAAGFAGGAFYRTLLPLVTRMEPAGAVMTASRRARLEREKALVLRSIKELEFDRAMGKVSPQDFDEMSGRLRNRALSLMRQLDATAGYGELIERELQARLASGRTKRGGGPPPAADASSSAAESAMCACGSVNDADAAFCKRCGARLRAGADA